MDSDTLAEFPAEARVGGGSGDEGRPSGTLESVRPGALSALLKDLARAPDSGEADAWDRALQPGLLVGKFELVQEIGSGGFGVVWEARDRELGRSVAFKAVRAGGKTAARGEGLLREAEAAAMLSHPNIVTLHDLGRSAQGPYLVLELLRGRSLEERLSQGPLPPMEAVHVATEVAKGVAYAHAQGVVHRDLKPGNVFLCDDGQVKVLDFGLAHAFGHRAEAGGTSGYMAPEQVKGAPEDERTDVFAFGALLFRMLAGKLPFPRDRGNALQGPGKAPALEVPGVPELGELVGRMLATQPVDRPRDGGEVLAVLAPIERELARLAATPAGQVRTRRGARAARAGLLAASVTAGVVAGAVGGWWVLRAGHRVPPPSEPVTLAVLPLANPSGDPDQEYLSDGMTAEITSKLSQLGGLTVTPRSSAAKYKGSQKSAAAIGKELGVAYVVEGSAGRAGDRIRVRAALVRTADGLRTWSESMEAPLGDVLGVQERVATRIVEAMDVRLSSGETGSLGRWGTRNPAAYDDYLRGLALVERFTRRENMVAAQSAFGRALQTDPAFAPAMVGLALAEATIYRNFDASPDRLARTRVLLDRALAIDPTAPRALGASGLLRAVSWDYRGAAEDFRRATAIEPRNHWNWDALCFALAYMTPPETVEAERACRRALDLNPGYPEALYHLARVLVLQGRLAEAGQAIDHVAELSPDSTFVYSGRFWIHLGAKRPREALAALANPGNKEFVKGTALSKAWTTVALAQAGDPDGALATLDDALAKGYRDVDQLRGDPYLEPLRGDPRFARLLARYGIALKASAPGRAGGAEQ